MNILSLFDGIATGRLALKKAGINVDKYYSSEIDKYAIKVAQHHFPDIIQLGDIINWKEWDIDWKSIDLITGASPCQSFSQVGKQEGFEGKSGIIEYYFQIVEHVRLLNPSVKILLENVIMKKEWENIISSRLGIIPVVINSSLVSAQNRIRNYWCSYPISQPEDLNIQLQNILEDSTMMNKATIVGRRVNINNQREDNNKSIPIVQCLEVRDVNRNKSNCLTTVDKDNVLTSLPVGRYIDVYNKKLPYRNYTLKECCRLQTIPDDYFEGVRGTNGLLSINQAKKCLGNGWTCDVIVWIFSHLNKSQ